MNPDDQIPACVLIPIVDDRLETYREALFNQINAPDVYEEITDPHITIHPGFTTTPPAIETIRAYLAGQDSLPKVKATATYAYPSPDDPAIIAAAVRAGLPRLREDINHILEAYDHSVINDPSPAHITLLKRRDIQSDDIPDDAHERARKAIEEIPPPSGALRTGTPRVEWYNPPYTIDAD